MAGADVLMGRHQGAGESPVSARLLASVGEPGQKTWDDCGSWCEPEPGRPSVCGLPVFVPYTQESGA